MGKIVTIAHIIEQIHKISMTFIVMYKTKHNLYCKFWLESTSQLRKGG